MILPSRSSHRTPIYDLATASHEELNSGSSYRVRVDREVLSVSAKTVGQRTYYSLTKRVRGCLYKNYLGTCGEISAATIERAALSLLDEIAARPPTRRRKRGSTMRAKQMMVFDLLEALDVVAEAPLAEQKGLYEVWRDNTSRTLTLALDPEAYAAWEAFSEREIDWASENIAALHLHSLRAYLRALVSVRAAAEREGRASRRHRGAELSRFTRRARQVLTLAQAEAVRLKHSAIGGEHLLVGLAQVEDGVSSAVLAQVGVTVAQVQGALEELLGQGTEDRRHHHLGLGREVKRAIEGAVGEARRREQQEIGTAHLLLALVQQEDSGAATILRRLGVSLEEVRQETERRLNEV
jgi:hypothetical protein